MEIIQKKCALELINQISKKIKNSELKESQLKSIEIQLSELSIYLDCNENETLIFAVIFALFVNKTCFLDFMSIAEYLSIDNLDLLAFQNDFESLISKGLIIAKNNLRSYSIPFKRADFSIENSIIHAIFVNEKIVLKKIEKKVNNFDFVKKISNLINLRLFDDFSTCYLIKEMEILENEFCELELVRKVKDLRFCVYEKLLFYGVCNDFF